MTEGTARLTWHDYLTPAERDDLTDFKSVASASRRNLKQAKGNERRIYDRARKRMNTALGR